MKRCVSFLIILIMIFVAFPNWGLSSSKMDWKESYKKYIKQVLSDGGSFSFDPDMVMVLVDLDRDGIPELIGGEAYRLVSWIGIAKTIRNGQIVDIRQDGVEDSEKFTIGMYAFLVNDPYHPGIKLYKDRNTGEYRYIGIDGYSSAISWGETEYEISLNGSTLRAKEIISSQGPNPGHENDPDVVEAYYIGNKKVSKTDFEAYRRGYYANLISVAHGGISTNFSKLYDFDLKKPDEAGINAFLNSYSPSDAIKTNQIPADWAKTEIDQAIALNLVPDELRGGYANQITRSDFCRLIMQMLTVKTGKTVEALLSSHGKSLDTTAFKDTADQTILSAHALGIVSGKGNGQFDPDGSITRQEAAVMLTRAATVMGLDVNRSGVSFTDYEQIAEWAKASVSFVSASKDRTNGFAIMSGTGNGQFRPLDYYSRQQAILTVKRLYNAE